MKRAETLKQRFPGGALPQWKRASHSAWDRELGRIDIEAPQTDRRIFYTALYHALQVPRLMTDVSGLRPKFADGSPVKSEGHQYYDDFSMWDIFRAQLPLLTILAPKLDGELMQSLVEKGSEGGFMPIFPMWNNYTSEMVGDHPDAAIADAYIKGIRNFDVPTAYALMRHNAFDQPATFAEYVEGHGRRALQDYLKLGYIPLENPVAEAFHKKEQVSRTLEYAYDDFALARVAKSLGHDEDAAALSKRAQNYRNVIDPEDGFARGRHADGSWITSFDPGKPASYITEGLPFQYTFFVPQDLPGLIELEHGRAGFTAKLDELFAKGYYDHGNEPSHSITYLYDYAGQAWKTQQHVAEIRAQWYKDGPAGLAGNDDAGQMSAWYVFSALGFYPVTPGIPAYEIGTPLLLRGIIHGHNPDAEQDISAYALRSLALARIERCLHDPAFGPANLVADLRVSRSRLYAAFAGGEGIAATIRNARLDRAHDRILRAPKMGFRIGSIMASCGLTDPAAFSRAFRQRFGLSPRDLLALGDTRLDQERPRSASMM